MPLYVFQNPNTGENVEVFFHMDEEKEYIDEEGLKWSRVLLSPQLNTEASIDPWSNDDFVNKTSNTQGSIGDLMDRSQELSFKRSEEHGGVDPVKEKYYKKYSEKRNGAKHQDQMQKFENKDVKVDYGSTDT